MKAQDKSGKPSGSSDAPKKNNFYTLCTSVEKNTFPDVVISMLEIYNIDSYALLYPGAIVRPPIAKKFDTLPNILHEPFLVSTLVGE